MGYQKELMSKFWLPTFVFIVISAIFTWTVFMTARSEASGGPRLWPVLLFVLIYLAGFIKWGCKVDTDHH